MKTVISTEQIPIKMWLNNVEESATVQARNLANLPFAFKHISLMPDAHSGYGMPIGGILATRGVIIPNAVGVDIGCGMCAIQTNLSSNDFPVEKIKNIMSQIRDVIPLGFDHHKERQDESLMPSGHDLEKLHIVKQQYTSALKQIGTLGGGNHFIEIQKDQNNMIWIMIHSGSRNLGLKVAEYYNKKAKKLNEIWHSSVSAKADLAFLPFETDEAKQYYKEMRYCVDFAFASRSLMMQKISEIMISNFPTINLEPMINIAHNYAAWEEHFGEAVIIHRKGATSAKVGEIGIIPGSQGTKSYIVEGLGNPESFSSCSHGAGRLMSRSKAIKTLSVEEESKKLNDLGVVHSIRTKKDLDEASSAYKDIFEVMDLQKDLVKIKFELSPLAVIKG